MHRTTLTILALLIAGTADGQTAASPPPEPELLNSVLWTQTSVEYDGAYLQAYQLARLMLDRARSDQSWSATLEQAPRFERLPPAVILDVDETILDNSPEEAERVVTGSRVRLWEDWVRQERATALPGAVAFTQYAQSRGVAVFYVTNRMVAEKPATRRKLAQLGFPLNPKVDPIYCRGEKPEWDADKGSRRTAIVAKYRILLIGDDLGDFISGARVGGPEDRRRLAAAHASYWGERWIVLPNSMYGSWETALYGNDTKLDRSDRLARKREKLKK